YEEFLQSYQWAREAGFQNINIDLMFAIPGQTGEAWRAHRRQVAELKPEHISAYSLIIEEGTPFAECELDLPDEDTEYQM
ncbi:oxygen-independent coproporphyrinogen III oxidase, partial [Levilactobacillus namurensis]|nr:oxygen-independent coproporphyrinogen III oxidase [Levilactobacillus namurensis]